MDIADIGIERSNRLDIGFGIFGGARRDRTDDLYNAIVALSQLSYGPTFWGTGDCRPAPLDNDSLCGFQAEILHDPQTWANRANFVEYSACLTVFPAADV